MRQFFFRSVILTTALFLLGSTTASASVLLASARTSSPFTFTFAPGGSSTALIPLNDAGATSLTFSTATAQTVVVTFSGECSGNTAGTWVGTWVYIDGALATGEGAYRLTRLCAGGEPQKAVSRTVFKSLAAGNHTIQIYAWVEGAPYTFYQGTFERTVLTVTN
jgi:hypothetical protein